MAMNVNTNAKPTVLVTGATGLQGGAVVTELLKGDKLHVRALARNPASPSAQALKARGVDLVRGDLYDAASLRSALEGCDRAFLVTQFEGPKGTAGEVESGKLFVDCAKAAGVKQLVFSSVGNADTHTGVPHFESKRRIEEHLLASGLEGWTILRPVVYMDNLPSQPGVQRAVALRAFTHLLAGKSLKLVAVEDIGWFAARALEEPGEWKGKELTLAGDDLTVERMRDAWARAQGSRPVVAPVPGSLLNIVLPGYYAKMFKFFREKGYDADIPTLREMHPGILTFEQWVRAQSQPAKP
ncbi:NAD(P)-binding protein [Calocera cornea HHB12733]|uniref:NAD(P)-binding protein n=1 Tax=Calocera cornea HHB12733 TaxID=1353952 RepID=A0A165FLT8_9BASI|nr:NAD(P)-binding protein [Calocera cornea HHB12733]